ncbi:MAG TPA: hypothetical protein VMZ91_09270 [Candidatus Paceibacterota bacterium]|nr:hypothetical protein [Candidatus Paceibacterota bacterium]
MIRNNSHKSVLVEKIYNFDKNFSILLIAKFNTHTVYGPPVGEFKKYWNSVYKNGHSYSLKKETIRLNSRL